MKIKYVGPHARIDYPISVERDKTIDVPAKLGRELVKQASWKRVQSRKKEKE